MFDGVVDLVLETILAGTVNCTLAATAAIMYSKGRNRFCLHEEKPVDNGRQKKSFKGWRGRGYGKRHMEL